MNIKLIDKTPPPKSLVAKINRRARHVSDAGRSVQMEEGLTVVFNKGQGKDGRGGVVRLSVINELTIRSRAQPRLSDRFVLH